MDVKRFFDFVITAKQGGWLCIAASDPGGGNYKQYWRAWPDDKESACELVQGLKDDGKNVYYSAHLFSEKDSHKQYAMETATLFVDLDKANVANIPLRPSLLLSSSDDKHQGYWKLNDWLTIEEFEKLSHRLTYGIHQADRSGWSIGHMMRVPDTMNYKYQPAQRVRVRNYNIDTYNALDFGAFPVDDGQQFAGTFEITAEWIEHALRVPAGYGTVHDLWETIQPKMAKGSDIHMYTQGTDRSTCLWRLMLELFRVGCAPEQVFLLAHNSVNNKFDELRYNRELELAKDVMRAYQEHLTGPAGIRDRINEARNGNTPLNKRRQAIAAMARNQMETHGKFIHCRGGTLWYVLNEEGKPIPISKVSTQLNVVLDMLFGLNATEAEHQYVVAHLINYTANLPPEGEIGALSYYLPDTNTLLLHTGKKDVVRITTEDIDIVTNGYRNIIFAWDEETTFVPDLESNPIDWSDLLFEGALDHMATDGISTVQALALLRSWFMALLLRNSIVSRPILAIFGQPGSGKSTLFRRIMVLLYGPHKAVSGITTADDFDFQLASDPLVIIDNVDTWEKWLPDRIARAAAVSEIKKRKLYTDVDTITLRSQAMLGITAHNPKFGREDVTDRLIMITLERLPQHKPESPIIERIVNMRNQLWGSICHDVQRILREPVPTGTNVPEFRVSDFAALGQQAANALGYGVDFYSAVTKLVREQKGFVLDEDSMLVDLLDKYVKNPSNKPQEYKTPAQLWGRLELLGGGTTDRNFSKQYGNSIKLGKKLWAMMDSLQARFTVRYKSTGSVRVWSITEKIDDGNEA